ncbi:hypothetical protein EVAR_24892_1 [Eumeta japonica]|uniref:BZIP domain-containing protein n=1 Tax=Eumeta variegata TaxID=151549 RepID=A0A4C1V584_EUMVA|nr:hypothetical protein EVAR_24892_1 [Eumeta japonica]
MYFDNEREKKIDGSKDRADKKNRPSASRTRTRKSGDSECERDGCIPLGTYGRAQARTGRLHVRVPLTSIGADATRT